MDGSSQRSRTSHTTTILPFMLSQRIAELRREVEGIQELNTIYRSQKPHTHQNQAANERRKIRLEEIVRQLAVFRSNGINAHNGTT
jgi:hypothetical protein